MHKHKKYLDLKEKRGRAFPKGWRSKIFLSAAQETYVHKQRQNKATFVDTGVH